MSARWSAGLPADLLRAPCSRRCRGPCRRRARPPSAASSAGPSRRRLDRAQAEVEDLDCPSRVTNRFSGFRSRWTMPLLVRGGQPARDLAGELDGLADGQGACVESLAQRLALEQLHDGVGDAACAAEVVRSRGCSGARARRRPGLALEARAALRIARPTRRGRTLIATSRVRAWRRARGRPRPCRPRRAARGSRTGRAACRPSAPSIRCAVHEGPIIAEPIPQRVVPNDDGLQVRQAARAMGRASRRRDGKGEEVEGTSTVDNRTKQQR